MPATTARVERAPGGAAGLPPLLLSRAPLHVLLVEDNLGDVELVRDAVAELDVVLDVAHDGVQALEFLCQNGPYADAARPDLVLLDLKLPRIDGLEVLARMARDAELRSIPVVVLTSSQAPDDLARAYELNARACFAKPGSGLRRLLADIIGFVRQALPPPAALGGPARAQPAAQRVATDEIRRVRQLAAIVDAAADAIIGADDDGIITTWNGAAERLYGHKASEAIGRHLRLIVPEERSGELDALVGALAAAPVQRMRTVHTARDGRELHVALTFSPIVDSLGGIVGTSAIARDITEQQQAEERFRLAVEASPSAMLMVGTEGEIVMLNAEAERLFGYTRNELIGTSVDRLVPERFRAHHPAYRDAFVEAPEFRAMGGGRELYGLRKDGVEVPIEIGLNPISTNDGTLVLSSIVDITDRRHAEHKFRLAVEAAPSGIVMVDAAGVIVLANAETERMFGYAPGDLVGRCVELLVPQRFRGQHGHHRQSFARAPEARNMGTGRDLHGRRFDGSEFPVEVGLNPIETPEGGLVLCTIVDITSRKHAEEALAAQAKELARSNDELEQFAYVASHDLQEPLRMVSSYTELLRERYQGALDATADRYIAFAQDGATRMRRLIDDLLEYSRVRTRGDALRPTAAARALARALANLRASVEESEATFDLRVDATVLADASQLRQLFQNLLSNALKFRGDAPLHVSVTSRREGDMVVFAVRDNGIGIRPEYADRVFQMFERLHTRAEYPGTGIGLALCKRIVERHGGRIWIESDGEAGATCLFTLRGAAEE